MTSFHPAFILRFPNAIHEVHLHLGALQRHLAGRAPVVTQPHIVPPFSPTTPEHTT